MRLLILSDIHANLTALDAALKACDGLWDRVICLGDIVGYGPDPNETVDRIRSLSAVAIRGNHDKAAVGLEDIDDFNPIARHAALWTRTRLRSDSADYLRQLPAGPKELDAVCFVHGSVLDEDEYVFAPSQAIENILKAPQPVTFFGHTHVQGGFAIRENADTVEVIHVRAGASKDASTLALERESRYMLNPGSIGQPRDGDPRAGFAIADINRRTVEFWRVDYGIDAVQERMRAAGLPEALSLRLNFGR